MSSRATTRPSTRGASWRRIVSTSGSSGTADSVRGARWRSEEGRARKLLGLPAREPLQHRGSNVGQRAVVAVAVLAREGGQQGRVLARVVGVRRARVDAVVGGEHEQVAVAQPPQPLADGRVDLAQRAVKALDVVAVA